MVSAIVGSTLKGPGQDIGVALLQTGGTKNFFAELNLTENMMQLKHEAHSSWLPKFMFLGGLRGIGGTVSQDGQKASPLECLITTIRTIIDELAVEVVEAATCYFVPSVLGSFLSLQASKLVGLKDHMIAGQPYKTFLSKKVGENITVGKVGRQREHLLTPETLDKAVKVKFFAVLFTTAVGMFLEGIAPTLQNIFSLKVLKTGSFLELSGVPLPRTNQEKEEQNRFIWDRSMNFIKKMSLVFGTALAAITSLSLLGGKRNGFMNIKTMGKALNVLDFSYNYELSRGMLAGIFGIGMWSYLAGSRPEIIHRANTKMTINPEFWECFFRASLWVIPAALVLKDWMTNFLAWRFVGKPNNLEVLTPMPEVLQGPFFDFKRLNLQRVQNLPKFKSFNLEKQTKVLKQLKAIEKKHVFRAVFGVGMVINTLNFLRTLWMSHHAQDKEAPFPDFAGLEFESRRSNAKNRR
jgi:hypothetical protein